MGLFNKNISLKMRSEAVSLGLCDKWQEEWTSQTTKEEMIEKFIRGQDFCIKHDWPSVSQIKKYGKGLINRYGVYADEKFVSDSPTTIAMGSCDGSIYADKHDVRVVYLRHKSKIKIEARGESRVFISIYDDSHADIKCYENAKVFVYRYGGTVKANGDVKVRQRDVNNE